MRQPKNRFEWIIILLFAVVLGGAWIAASRETVAGQRDTAALTEAPFPGHLAPDFTLTTIGAETVTLSELRGQPVVLNFWATWCPPCRVEMPFFQEASRKYNGRVAILGVSDGETADTVANFAADRALTYSLLPDTESDVARAYGVRSLPTTFFIDADGVVTELHPGIITQAVLDEKIEGLLASE